MASNGNADQNQLHDKGQEKRQFTRRSFIAGAGVLVLMGLIGGRMGQLQVAGHQRYSSLSQANRVKLVPIPPNRGLIYDRNGVLLAENRPNFQLLVTPEQVQDMEDMLAHLTRTIDISDTEIDRFRQLRSRSRNFEALPLKVRLTEKEVAAFAANRHRFPGVEVEARLSRHYPHGEHAAHAIGYVGRINERELARVDTRRYGGSSHIGKSGTELQFEERLHGHAGLERVETNALGRVIKPLGRRAPDPGDDMVLTLDSHLQRAAEDALGDESGSIVVMDVHNSDVLALVSKPSFDPNIFVNGVDRATYAALQEDPDRPLFNRAVRGQYPPGSTIKPFIGLAGLEAGIFDPEDTIFCPGHYSIDDIDHRWRCWRRQGHGDMDFADAMSQSCDVYYYKLGYDLGIDRMSAFLERFGFGQRTGAGIPGERTGILPSREWKRAARGEGWFHGETIITSIGQGYFLSTPLQLAHAMTVLANRGHAAPPRVLRAVHSASTGETYETEVPEREQIIALAQEELWDVVHESLVDVVHSSRGTGRGINTNINYRIAGKTGTSQVFSLGQDQEYDEEEVQRRLRNHALFTAYAPADDPRIAVSVLVEHGGGGGAVAAPVARKVIDAYLRNVTAEPDDV
ncbi:penicillin-binding protein 2 [Aquisalimonas sp.]|uniref:penicillin-binding protein 2 n=1 Tax=unclassified Aquisalimonas TaxID=2644645 RepID=UPI0025BACBA3|nr:penicillin-binding protein 2 [Aquisalimonas sp.]